MTDRRTLRYLLSAALCAFIICELAVRGLAPLLGAPLEYYAPVAQAKVAQVEAHGGRPSRVVFAGNSTVVEGADIASFMAAAPCAGSAYNAGLNGATTHIVRRYIGEKIIPATKPSVVVYGLSVGSFSDVNDTQIAQYDSAPATRITRPSALKRFAEHLSLYRYRNTLRDPQSLASIYYTVTRRSVDQGIIDRIVAGLDDAGDKRDRTSFALAPGTLGPHVTTPAAVIPEVAYQDVATLARQLEHQGGQLLLVSMPSLNRADPTPETAAELARRLHLPFVDAGPAIDDASDFVDGVHLNASGAQRLGAWLGTALRRYVC